MHGGGAERGYASEKKPHERTKQARSYSSCAGTQPEKTVSCTVAAARCDDCSSLRPYTRSHENRCSQTSQCVW
jgi:hypothetical protein